MDKDLFAKVSSLKEEDKKDVTSNFYRKIEVERFQSESLLKDKKSTSTDSDESDINLSKIPKSYTHQEVLAASTLYFGGDDLAANVWMNKYALKNSAGEIFEQTPDEMHERIASEIGRIEQKYPDPISKETILGLLKDFKYIIPAGSPMAGIGNNFQASSLSNCFVIGNDGSSDSYGGIMKIDQEQVQLMKRRGGVGHDLSHIRPAGSAVKNSALTSTGIVPFMERYSNSTREVAQDGRRGALMLSISVKHPDVEAFIDAKMVQGKVTGANVSVKITDDFMHAVVAGSNFHQQYPIDSDNPKVVREADAVKIWDKIINNAWSSAEPGILFWDTIIKESVPDSYADMGFKTVSTNPCGEIPLCPYDSCRLLALNLYSYVDNPFTDEAVFNSELFAEHVHYAQRIMDDIIDLEIEKIDRIIDKIEADPEDKEIKRVELNLWENIKRKSIEGRRTGIGITAEGDMLAALNLRYGSDEAVTFSVEVHKLLAIEAYRSSINLAKSRGAFPIFNYEREADNPFVGRIREAAPEVIEDMKKYGRRNIALLTIAPAGSVSICTQTSSGIEPVFMVAYKRRRKVNPNDQNVTVSFVDELGDSWEEYNVFHPKFKEWLKINGHSEKDIRKYSEKELNVLIEKSPYYKATSNDIDWLSKVKMQGQIQKWVDHSISVTVNLPADATKELVSDVYKTAWESGCKGMTIYRDGSRSGVMVAQDKEKKSNTFCETQAPIRPKRLDADVIRFQNDYEKWIAVVGLLDGKPYEVFTGQSDDFYLPPWVEKGAVIRNKKEGERARYDFQFLDKQGYKVTSEGLSRTFNKTFWNYAKLISGILRHGMPLYQAVELISNLNFDKESINTWKNGVVRSLKKYIPDGTNAAKNKCPECGVDEGLIYKEGCLTCKLCGYSKCE
ncbi:MAG: adenosylcobalamin-dependent ribonucleoside-diphosphate reductase [Bacteroidales bacterium]|jgi:ribonucleoside-diphosphate reductase alpha chain|nr:adenosylcobalamin-dependent ribonucleoside-diphosphate reductase [Bacteroidales bacterium]